MNIVVGAGIFAVPAALAASVGSYAPVAFLVCAIGIGAVAICFAEGGSRVPTSGGAYGYVSAAFGPLVGYVAGTLLWFSNALACGSIAAALANVAQAVLPPPWRSTARVLIILGVVGGVALVNLRGVSLGTRLVNVAVGLKLIPLAIFIIAGVTVLEPSNFEMTMPGTENLGRALILALFSFTGMEVPLSASGELAHPARDIPRALAVAMISVTVLYVAVQVIAQGILGEALAHSNAPLVDAMARISPTLRLVLLGGAAVSMLGWIGSDILGTPRVLFAFARDGLLPGVLGKVHAQSGAPRIAIMCYAALAIGFALTGTFAELAVLAALGSSALYIAGCAAAWQLARRGVAYSDKPLKFRWLGTAAAVGISSMMLMIALASHEEITGLLTVLGVSAGVYVLQTRLRRRPL